MTRAELISDLRRQYAQATADRKWKRASQIYAHLQALVSRQLRAENKADRRKAS